ncbi:MAG TPA: hypothetical protein VG370_31280 [Chloroflexota bacterium]|nr:hypothetical protein [Chloroflexota bacterium]
MDSLRSGLAVFFLLGLAQVALAGRLVDLIHGGPGRRGPKGRALDVLILRAAGGFVAVLSGIALVVVSVAEVA